MSRHLAGLLALAVASEAAAQARIPEVRASGRTPCEVHPETALDTAELWLAARTALTGSLADDPNPPLLLVQHWRATLGGDLTLRWADRDTARIATRQPFSKEAPSNLERVGYIQRRGAALVYYGPDADLILSERFLRQHCFRRIEGAGGTTGLVGLTFEPLPTQQLPDVSGALWVDPAVRELRFVEYTWTNPPVAARAPAAGGRTDFVRLASGGWIIQRWNIRMPRPDASLGSGLDGYTDQGGAVIAVGPRTPRRP